MSLVSRPFGGWICPEGMGMSGAGTHPPEDGTSGEVSTYPPDMGYNRIFAASEWCSSYFKCFLVHHITTP